MNIKLSFYFMILGLISFKSYSQIVINEVYINSRANDGSPNPNTGEWVEFYNTSGSSVDVSCWVFCDGDFCVTIPDGTTITANGFFLVGSAAGVACGSCDFNGTTIDLDWATCSCTAGSSIGTFTNGGEQVALFDNISNIINAVYWSGGQGLPDTGNSSAAVGVCSVQSLDIPATSDPVFENIGSGGGNGQSKARTTNGGSTWASEPNPTPRVSNTPLPVTLISFHAVPSENQVNLSWSTASEVNNHYFTVERSIDAVNFTRILRVEGSGNSSTRLDYACVDPDPLPGRSYYRLWQQDYDGTTEVFNIVPVNLAKSNHIILFPQPANAGSSMEVRFWSDFETVTEVTVMTSLGQIVYEITLTASIGGHEIQIPPVETPGVYFVTVNNSQLFHRQQLVIH